MATSILACAACLRRAVQVAPRNPAFAEASILLHSYAHRLPTRQYATATATAAATRPAAFDAPQSLDMTPLEPSVAEKKEQDRMMRNVKKEMIHLDDPWKLAQNVEQKLAKDRFDEALLMTQMASKTQQVVVSWNHLINYQLENQQLKKGIKLYNDMKKRAQLPSVHTFTIIFRGLSKSVHPKLAVAEAVKQYNILINDTRLEPNAIHLNAVLNVCAKAGDIDSMFLIADTANESTRAPTAYTYTTILNALRYYATRDMKELSLEQQQAVVVKVINQSKGLWMEVMEKWKQGRLVIDEELVCAMGRMIMLEPKREDRRQVLDLFEQTMSIPNLEKSPESNIIQDPEMENIAVAGNSKRVPKSKSVYAAPGRNALGLVLTVLASSKSTKVGIKYWNLMVRHYGIIPDRDNWFRMLGMLKVAKASAHAATIVDYLPDEYVSPKPYQIAMEAVVRDNINLHVMKHANRVLNASVARLSPPDVHTMRLYLRAALVSHHQMRVKMKNGDEVGAKRDYGIQITAALVSLWEPYKTACYHAFKVRKASNQAEEAVLYNEKREVMALARLMVSAFNKVMNETMLPEQDTRDLRPICAKINREIQAFYANREEMEPKLRKGSDEASGNEPPEGALEAEPTRGGKPSRQGRGARRADEDEPPIWGADYKPDGDYIWDTTPRVKGTDAEERQKYEDRVKRREVRGITSKYDAKEANNKEESVRKRYEKVVGKYEGVKRYGGGAGDGNDGESRRRDDGGARRDYTGARRSDGSGARRRDDGGAPRRDNGGTRRRDDGGARRGYQGDRKRDGGARKGGDEDVWE